MASIEFDTDVRMIPITENIQAELDKLTAEGWQLMAGAPPVAIYYLIRPKQAAGLPLSAGASAQLRIDDTKVHILRNGQLVPQ